VILNGCVHSNSYPRVVLFTEFGWWNEVKCFRGWCQVRCIDLYMRSVSSFGCGCSERHMNYQSLSVISIAEFVDYRLGNVAICLISWIVLFDYLWYGLVGVFSFCNFYFRFNFAVLIFNSVRLV